MAEILTKIILVPVFGFLFFRPFFAEGSDQGLMPMLQSYGMVPFAAVAIVFVALVALYCRSLFHCLQKTSSAAIGVKPESAWMMFVIPLNFIEDFFIIRNVSKSIEQSRLKNPRMASISGSGKWSGYAWCSLQLISLLPTTWGEVGGLIALPFWFYHWYFIAKVNRTLSTKEVVS